MLNLLFQFFKTGPDVPQIADAAAVKKKFNSMRWRVFASITIGYAFYYIIRQQKSGLLVLFSLSRMASVNLPTVSLPTA